MAKRIDPDAAGVGTLLLIALALAIVTGLSWTAAPSPAPSLAFEAPHPGVQRVACPAHTWAGAIARLDVVPPQADPYSRLAACKTRAAHAYPAHLTDLLA